MSRLVMFVLFCVGLAALFSLKSYKTVPVDNTSFDYEVAKANYEAKQELLAEVEEMRKQREKTRAGLLRDEEEVVEELPVVVLDSPQLERGHDLYQSCIVCHGRQGEGRPSQNSPRIGGQYEWYLEQEITKMRDGERVNAIMAPYVRRLSDQDIADLSAYISKLPHNWSEYN